MGIIETAILILKRNNNVAMSGAEILGKNKEYGYLWKSNGKTPLATTNAMLASHSINSEHKKQYKPDFRIIGSNPQKFELIDLNNKLPIIESIVESIEEIVREPILLYSITDKKLNWKKLSIYNNSENIEYKITECEEYTYFIKDNSKKHLIKIGKTTGNPENRLSNLRTGNTDIFMYHVIPSSVFTELQLHDKFNKYRYELEWFFLTQEIKDF
jgi:hypothetical protein